MAWIEARSWCRVPTLDGEADIRVRPGTQPGDRLRMRGYGVPHIHNPNRKVRAGAHT